MARLRVASLAELPRGTLKNIELEGTPICLARIDDGSVYAISDICTHEASQLSEGTLEGIEVECPTHSSRFDVRTGAVTGAPARVPVRSYATDVVGDDVYVELDDRS